MPPNKKMFPELTPELWDTFPSSDPVAPSDRPALGKLVKRWDDLTEGEQVAYTEGKEAKRRGLTLFEATDACPYTEPGDARAYWFLHPFAKTCSTIAAVAIIMGAPKSTDAD